MKIISYCKSLIKLNRLSYFSTKYKTHIDITIVNGKTEIIHDIIPMNLDFKSSFHGNTNKWYICVDKNSSRIKNIKIISKEKRKISKIILSTSESYLLKQLYKTACDFIVNSDISDVKKEQHKIRILKARSKFTTGKKYLCTNNSRVKTINCRVSDHNNAPWVNIDDKMYKITVDPETKTEKIIVKGNVLLESTNYIDEEQDAI